MTNLIILPASEKEYSRQQRLPIKRARHAMIRKASGEPGLLSAIIALATLDFAYGEPDQSEDAAAYFMSRTYRDHLSWLDLPEDWLPVLLTEGA